MQEKPVSNFQNITNEEHTMAGQEARVDIGNGVELWLHSMGQGSPAILLEAPGPGCDSEPWMAIQPRLAQITQTYRYDRAGTGKSTGTELSTLAIPPRTQDLEKLLEAASVEPPYVMVGYSFGGAIVLRYARQHLDRMAGLVLVESSFEPLLARYNNEPPPAAPDTGHMPPLGDLPLVVMTIDTQEYPRPPLPNLSREETLKLWLAAQAELAALSTRGRQVFVKNTNHYAILDSHAEDVIDAIRMVVEEARR
jgi:pimeloyl-ACP methyl ester carboxylesterase